MIGVVEYRLYSQMWICFDFSFLWNQSSPLTPCLLEEADSLEHPCLLDVSNLVPCLLVPSFRFNEASVWFTSDFGFWMTYMVRWKSERWLESFVVDSTVRLKASWVSFFHVMLLGSILSPPTHTLGEAYRLYSQMWICFDFSFLWNQSSPLTPCLLEEADSLEHPCLLDVSNLVPCLLVPSFRFNEASVWFTSDFGFWMTYMVRWKSERWLESYI